MAAYSQFLRQSVKVQYRLGDILLIASGTFVGDSGRSIFLEERLEQRGKQSYFRWEIPYGPIHRIEVVGPDMPADSAPSANEPAAERLAQHSPPSSAKRPACVISASKTSRPNQLQSFRMRRFAFRRSS